MRRGLTCLVPHEGLRGLKGHKVAEFVQKHLEAAEKKFFDDNPAIKRESIEFKWEHTENTSNLKGEAALVFRTEIRLVAPESEDKFDLKFTTANQTTRYPAEIYVRTQNDMPLDKQLRHAELSFYERYPALNTHNTHIVWSEWTRPVSDKQTLRAGMVAYSKGVINEEIVRPKPEKKSVTETAYASLIIFVLIILLTSAGAYAYNRFFPEDLNKDGIVNLEDVAEISRRFGEQQNAYVVEIFYDDPCVPGGKRALFYNSLDQIFPKTAKHVINLHKATRIETYRAVNLEERNPQ